MSRRAYLRLDPDYFERKLHYPVGAAYAFIAALCLAEDQPKRGRFRSEKLLRVLLDGPETPTHLGRWLPFLIECGDLILQDKGVLYIDGWDEWQEGDWKVQERVHRIRNRKAVTDGVTPDVTVPVTVDVTVPRYVAESGERRDTHVSLAAGAEQPARASGLEKIGAIIPDAFDRDPIPLDVRSLQKLAEELTQQPYVLVNVHTGLGAKAVTEQLPHGFARVEAAWRKIAAQTAAAGTSRPTLRQLVLGADDILNPILRQDEKARRTEEAQADFDKRVERTKAYIRDLTKEPA